MVDIEVDYRHPVNAVCRTGVHGANGHIVEQAEAHRLGRFGMMAGWPDRAKGVGHPAGHHRIDSGAKRAGGAQGSLAGGRTQRGIRIDLADAGERHSREQFLDEFYRVNPGNLFDGSGRGLAPVERRESRRLQGCQNRGQPGGALRMVIAHIVGKAGGMGIKRCGH